MEKNFTGIIYARVSTEQQGQDSIENQIERCQAYVKFKNNIIIRDSITDISSGGNDDREGLNKLLKNIKEKKIDVVIVTELSRLSRKIATLINIIEEAKKHEVMIISVLENIDTTTPMGKAMMLMNGIFAELERDNIKRRVKNTLDTKAQNGNHTGGVAPYGYDLINKKLVPNPEKAEIVKKLFLSFIKGKNMIELANEYKIKKTTVRRILMSETYIGTKIYGTRKIDSSGKAVKADPENIKIIPNAHEAIVEKDIFYIAQRMINRNIEKYRTSVKKQQKKYLLYGLLKCYNGHLMYGNETTAQYRFYDCSMHGRLKHFSKESVCPKKPISADKIEKDVWNHLMNIDLSKIDKSKGTKLKEKELEKAEAQLQIKKDKRSTLTDLFLEKELEKEEYLDRKKLLDKEISSLSYEIELLKSELKDNNAQNKSYLLLKKVIEKLKTEMSFEQKQKYLHVIINKIQFINDFEYEIYFNI